MADGVRDGLGWIETLGGFVEVIIIDITKRDDVFVCDMIDAERRLVGVADTADVEFFVRRLGRGSAEGAMEAAESCGEHATESPAAADHGTGVAEEFTATGSARRCLFGCAQGGVCESGRAEFIVDHSHQVRYRLGFGESQGPGVTVASMENEGKRKSR